MIQTFFHFWNMNLKTKFTQRLNKTCISLLAKKTAFDQKLLNELISLMRDPENIISMQASWVFTHATEINPAITLSQLKKIVFLLEKSQSVAVKRNICRSLQFLDIPETCQGKVYTLCFAFAANTSEAIAIRAFSLTILFNIALKHTDLVRELTILMQEVSKEDVPAIKSRTCHLLKAINRLQI